MSAFHGFSLSPSHSGSPSSSIVVTNVLISAKCQYLPLLIYSCHREKAGETDNKTTVSKQGCLTQTGLWVTEEETFLWTKHLCFNVWNFYHFRLLLLWFRLLDHRFPKCGPQTGSIRITWGLVRKAEYWFPFIPKTCSIRISGDMVWWPLLSQALWVTLMPTEVWEPLF